MKVSAGLLKKSISFSLPEVFNDFVGSFWFLWAIFWCSMVVLFVEKCLRGKNLMYGLICVCMLLAPTQYNIYLYAFVFPVFISGFLYAKSKHNLKIHTIKIACLSFVTFLIMLMSFNKNDYIYTTHISILESLWLQQVGIDIYRWIIGIVGSVFVISISKLVVDQYKNNTIICRIADFGKISLGVYILNSYTNKFILLRLLKNTSPNVLFWIMELVISTAVYIMIINLVNRITWLNKLLFGGR